MYISQPKSTMTLKKVLFSSEFNFLRLQGFALFTAGLLFQVLQQPAQAFVIAPTQAKWGSPIYGTPANVTWSLIGNGVSLCI